MLPVQDLQGEVYTDGGSVVLGEDLVHVALDDGRLPHTQVTDDQHFEQPFLVLLLHHACCVSVGSPVFYPVTEGLKVTCGDCRLQMELIRSPVEGLEFEEATFTQKYHKTI